MNRKPGLLSGFSLLLKLIPSIFDVMNDSGRSIADAQKTAMFLALISVMMNCRTSIAAYIKTDGIIKWSPRFRVITNLLQSSSIISAPFISYILFSIVVPAFLIIIEHIVYSPAFFSAGESTYADRDDIQE